MRAVLEATAIVEALLIEGDHLFAASAQVGR